MRDNIHFCFTTLVTWAFHSYGTDGRAVRIKSLPNQSTQLTQYSTLPYIVIFYHRIIYFYCFHTLFYNCSSIFTYSSVTSRVK